MAKVRKLAATGNLFLDFRFRGKRCREYTALPDSPANVKKLEKLASQIEADIKFGTFDYAKSFPGSKNVAKFATDAPAMPNLIAASVARTVNGNASEIAT